MEIPATITTKGQITIPGEIRKALGLQTGDRVMFRVMDGRAIIQAENAIEGAPSVAMEKLPDFFALAGSIPVPADVNPADWEAQKEAGWAAAVRRHQ